MKDSYYFPHFVNAKTDRKILRVRKELGLEGYAIFFMLLETLREQADLKYPLSDIDLLADEFGTSEQKVRTVISNYQLFEIDDLEQFFSPKLIIYLQPYFEMREKRRIAGRKGAESRWNGKAIAEPSHSHARVIANDGKVKDSKVNKSKVNDSKANYYVPTIETSVPINETTHSKLLTDWGESTVNLYYQKIYDHCQSTGKKYKDYASTARNWIQRDIDQGRVPKRSHAQQERPRCPVCGVQLTSNSGCGYCNCPSEDFDNPDTHEQYRKVARAKGMDI